MKLFAIKQISSGLFVPPGGKGLGGHTHQEPTAARTPRLFVTEKHAIRAMKAYIEGGWTEHYSVSSYSGETDYDGPAPQTGTRRIAGDFVVVPVTLREGVDDGSR